jgi:hypothetical protein
MRSGPLPNIPYKRLKSISETNPNLIYFRAPNQEGTSPIDVNHIGSYLSSLNRKRGRKRLCEAKGRDREPSFESPIERTGRRARETISAGSGRAYRGAAAKVPSTAPASTSEG